MPVVFCDPQSWGAFKRETIAKKVRAFPVNTAAEISKLVQAGNCVPQELLLDAIAQLASDKEARPLVAELRKWSRSSKVLEGLGRANSKKRKIKGTFCEERFVSKSKMASASFRWKQSGKTWLQFACLKPAWKSRLEECRKLHGKSGLKLFVKLSPKGNRKRCPRGQKKIQK